MVSIKFAPKPTLPVGATLGETYANVENLGVMVNLTPRGCCSSPLRARPS